MHEELIKTLLGNNKGMNKSCTKGFKSFTKNIFFLNVLKTMWEMDDVSNLS